MTNSNSSTTAAGGAVSVGHGPGVRGNDGTSPDRGTGAPDSNLTEIDPTEEPGGAGATEGKGRPGTDKPSAEKTSGLGTQRNAAQPR